jgi:hypothetical protein
MFLCLPTSESECQQTGERKSEGAKLGGVFKRGYRQGEREIERETNTT